MSMPEFIKIARCQNAAEAEHAKAVLETAARPLPAPPAPGHGRPGRRPGVRSWYRDQAPAVGGRGGRGRSGPETGRPRGVPRRSLGTANFPSKNSRATSGFDVE